MKVCVWALWGCDKAVAYEVKVEEIEYQGKVVHS